MLIKLHKNKIMTWSDNYKNCDYRPSSSVDLEQIASNNQVAGSIPA